VTSAFTIQHIVLCGVCRELDERGTDNGHVNGLAAGLCSHCRLPLPSRPYREEADGQALEFCCFGCLTVFRIVGSSGEAGRAGWFLAKLGLAAVLSGNVMMFQSLLYFGSLESMGEDVLHTASGIMLGLSVAVFFLLGVPMLRVAFAAARQGRIVLETLIALGALAAIGASAAETIRGGRQLYYDSGTMVLVFVVLGQYLDARARQKAADTLKVAVTRERPHARVRRDGEERIVPPEQVRRGERVRVRAGEEIPVDGRVLEGVSDVHEPALTGESVPRLVQPGDTVYADSIAADGALIVEASGESETLARRIERWTAEARTRRAPIEIAADEFVARFVPAVALIAIASGLGWGFLRHEWGLGGLAALSVLVVACPCALGIATPMATTIALSRAAGRGTLLRSGAALEALDRVRTIAFDKTGTITRGHPVVRDVRVQTNARLTESEILGLAAAVEVNVDHPFGRAIVACARERDIAVACGRETRSIPGGGAEGRADGHAVLLGSRALFEREGVLGTVAFADGSEEESVVAVAIDSCLVGEILLWDSPRPEARDAIAQIRSLGVTPRLLSGDRAAVVANIAREVGIQEAFGGLAPGEKARLLQQWRKDRSHVAMVGDGVNDAPALAAADVGIAFGGAADLARQTADAVVLVADLREVPRLLALARRTMRVVRQNLSWAFGYNAVGILLAALGFLRPVFAAAAMVLSSLFVVGNSLRLQRPERSFPAKT
jgi:P-type Cu2+ transporter